MKSFLDVCLYSTEFMTIEEFASISTFSAKQVARFVYILEDQGYVFKKRVRSNGMIEYRLNGEPMELHDSIESLT